MLNSILRPMMEADLPMVLQWRNSDDVRLNLYSYQVMSESEHYAWWVSHQQKDSSRLLICEIDGIPVGVVTFTGYTGKDGLSSWAFYSGDRSRRGVGQKMERLALDYAFDVLDVRKLECEVLSFNMAVVRFHQKHGFHLEGILREGYCRDGDSYDIFKLAMLRKDWKVRVRKELNARASNPKHIDYTGKRFSKTVLVDAGMVMSFAQAVSDTNPVHFDDQAAQSFGFKGRIAHGMLSGSLFSGFFATEFPGSGTIYLKQSLTFVAPVPIGSTVMLSFQVLSHIGRKLLIETRVMLDDQPCVIGEAEVLAPAA